MDICINAKTEDIQKGLTELSVHFRIEDDTIIVFGQTYPHKDKSKSLGARFNGRDKTWILKNSEDIALQVEALCRSTGGGPMGDYSQVTKKSDASLTLKKSPDTREKKPAPVLPENTLTVTDLMQKIHMTIANKFAMPMWVTGEIQNLSAKGSGIFLSLAEPKGEDNHVSTMAVRALLWRNRLNDIKTHRGSDLEKDVLQDGLQVRVLVQVEFYKDRGQVSLQILDIDPNFTKGALALAREKLLKELRAKGLDQKNKLVKMPRFPFRVGLITAKGSRAFSDFCDQLASHKFCGEVVFEGAPMQGEGVSKGVTTAISKLIDKGCDVIVLTRGGGSAADLRWFDDREVALAIAESPLPIIAAIGHHDDRCIAEEICHLRQKTPTAAAAYVLSRFEETRQLIEEYSQIFATKLDHYIRKSELQYQNLLAKLHESLAQSSKSRGERLLRMTSSIVQGMTKVSHQSSMKLQNIGQRLFSNSLTAIENRKVRSLRRYQELSRNANQTLNRLERSIAQFEVKVGQLNPMPWLEKGWTQIKMREKSRVISVENITKGDLGEAFFKDGSIKFQVEEVVERTNHE